MSENRDNPAAFVHLDTMNGCVRARPDSFLGTVLFQAYRSACSAAGARWSEAAGGNVAQLAGAAALKRSLEAAGFAVEVKPDLAAALAGMSNGIRKASGRLRERFASADAALRARGSSLADYQRQGAEWLAPCDRALLADQMGVGKTLQALVAAPEGPVMVVCPSVAKGVWAREAAMWRPDLATAVLSGKLAFRWPAAGELVALNYEILAPTMAEAKEAAKAEEPLEDAVAVEAFWRSVPAGVTLIADECHYLKSNKSVRSDRFRALAKAVLKRGGRLYGLTGTPLLNRPLELWNLLTTLQLHRDAFGDFLNFAALFGAIKNRWGVYEWPDAGQQVSPEIAGCLRKVMLRRLRKDVLPELPEKVRQYVPVEIPAAAKRMADKALEDLAARGISLTDALAAAELGKLGGQDFHELSRAREQLARALIPAAIEMVEPFEDAGEPVIVWSDHVAPVEAFRGRHGWAVITGGMTAAEKTAVEDGFQAGKFIGLACSIKAAGTAITLTRAANAVFVDRSYVPGENEQAEDRICRKGQTRGCVIRILVPDHQLCRDVMDILAGKEELNRGTVDAAATKAAPAPRVDVAALEEMARLGQADPGRD